MVGASASPLRPSDASRARARPVGLENVDLLDGFWFRRTEANRTSGIPHLYARLEEHGVVDNFRRRTGLAVARRGFWFTDSDLYKWMEAAAWSLVSHPDDSLERTLDDAVDVVLRAQDADGYLNTNFEGDTRFADLSWSHELYCAGHLMQAAIARHRASGKADLIDAAVRCADLLCREFGPAGRSGRDLHPGVEMALVEMYRETGHARYLDLARSFCDLVPHGQWTRLWGHAVCALYFASGLTDVALETGDAELLERIETLWAELVTSSTYLTGGVGGRWVGESIGRPFELPNEGAYAETCGAVGSAMWQARMLVTNPAARFADELERVLSNAFLAGVSLNGDEWCYANPLASRAMHEEFPFIGDQTPVRLAGPLPVRRAPWRDVTCCPPNANRLLATLPAYLYGESDEGLFVYLYASSRVRAAGFDITVETGLPWEGSVELTIHSAPQRPLSILLRHPDWSGWLAVRTDADVRALAVAGFTELRGNWAPGDRVHVDLELAVRVLECDTRVAENRGSVALQRGPLVYCLEGVDNPGVDVLEVAIDPDAEFVAEHRDDLLDGVTVLHGAGSVPDGSRVGSLYRPWGSVPTVERDVPIRAIPYCAWANRGVSPMTVWLRAR